MSPADAWLASATAGTALVGGFLGALLQGTSSARGWRRQTRLDAYAQFIQAGHQFHNAALDVISAQGLEQYPSKLTVLLDAQLALGRASSLVSIAGPMSCVSSMVRITGLAQEVTNGLSTPEAARQAAADDQQPAGYGPLARWISAAEDFEAIARAVLGTAHVNGYPLISRIRQAVRDVRAPAGPVPPATPQPDEPD